MESTQKTKFNFRAFVSVGLSIALLVLLITAISIQFFEDDPDSFEKHVSVSFHVLSGIAFIVLNILHLKLNWQSFKTYAKNRKGNINREVLSSILCIILFLVLGTFIVYLLLGG